MNAWKRNNVNAYCLEYSGNEQRAKHASHLNAVDWYRRVRPQLNDENRRYAASMMRYHLTRASELRLGL